MATKSIATLRRRADKLLQQVFMKDHPMCLCCPSPACNGHHYIYKSQSANLRYDLKNLVPLCAKCHMRHHFSGDPRIVQVILEKMGKKWADDLQARRRILRKINKTYLREVIEELEKKL